MLFTAQDLRTRVKPVIDVVRAALEEGLEQVEPTIQRLAVGHDPWFDSHLVRMVARTRIAEAAKAQGGTVWHLDLKVPNSGIHLTLPRATARLAHGSAQRVPAPGPSTARRRFWAQGNPAYFQDPLPIFEPPSGSTALHLNLLLLWERAPGSAVSLAVAVPRCAWPYGSAPRLHAFVPLEDDLAAEFASDDDEGLDLVAHIEDVDEAEGEAP